MSNFGIPLDKKDFVRYAISLIIKLLRHYKNAHAALLFFDFSNKKSFESLDSWIDGNN
jgi:hypothetical protein